jgi:antitoxin component YwqK of YwqJK toxin-antitoxin module
MKKHYIILAIIMLAGCFSLPAMQYEDEDQQMMHQYKLPGNAIAEINLNATDSLMLQKGKPFTGTAFSRFENGKLQHATQYVNGLKQGLMLVWYPDGKPQLMSTYRKGHLNGRFKGWYQFGAVIYDLVLKDDAYMGDDLYDEDTTRQATGADESESSGDGIDQSND